MSKSVMAYKNLAGEVYHIQDEKITKWSMGLCGYEIRPSATVTQFEDIKNPNVCRHCALEFQRRSLCNTER